MSMESDGSIWYKHAVPHNALFWIQQGSQPRTSSQAKATATVEASGCCSFCWREADPSLDTNKPLLSCVLTKM